MAVYVVPVSWSDYHDGLKPAIKSLGGELLNDPHSIAENGREVYVTPENVALYYDANKRFAMGHSNRKEVEKTKSKLEKLSGLKLNGE